MKETEVSWTSKCEDGCIPYLFICNLCNNGKSLRLFDVLTDVWNDVYVTHFTWRKDTGNMICESSTMHKHKFGETWQVVAPRRI